MEIQEYISILNTRPDSRHIEERQGIKYLPIDYIESKMDEIFGTEWGVRNVQTYMYGAAESNQWVTTLEVYFIHPVSGREFTRSGTASATAVTVRGSGKELKNSMETCAPHSQADAIKNACKGIGVVFGRDLNRDYKHIQVEAEFLDKVKESEVLERIEMIKTLDEFKLLRADFGQYIEQNRNVLLAAHAKYKEING